MSSANTTIAYLGKKVAKGEMDVNLLAPTLLAMGKIFERAHKIINDDDKGISVNVKAMKEGSFEIDFSIVAPLVEQAKTFFGVEGYKTAEQILKYIGLTIEENPKKTGAVGVLVGSLIALLLSIKGKRVKKITINVGFVKWELEDGETIETPEAVRKMYDDKNMRDHIGKLAAPLQEDGIDSLEIRKNRKVVRKIEKKHLPYLMGDATTEEQIAESKSWVLLQVDTPHITKAEKKWSFSTVGESKGINITAYIKDEDYLEKVKKAEILFKHGIRIRALLVTKTISQVGKNDRVEYEIEKVEHDPDRLL